MARMNRPAPVEITYKNMRFLITHNPTNATLNKFIEVRVFLREHYFVHLTILRTVCIIEYRHHHHPRCTDLVSMDP